MKNVFSGILLSVIMLSSGCGGNGDTSTGTGSTLALSDVENSITTGSGEFIQLTFKSTGQPGEAIQISYLIRDADGNLISGTIFWEDGSTSRIRGGGIVSHIYQNLGSYRIAVQLDGGDKNVAGTITITPANAPEGQNNQTAGSSGTSGADSDTSVPLSPSTNGNGNQNLGSESTTNSNNPQTIGNNPIAIGTGANGNGGGVHSFTTGSGASTTGNGAVAVGNTNNASGTVTATPIVPVQPPPPNGSGHAPTPVRPPFTTSSPPSSSAPTTATSVSVSSSGSGHSPTPTRPGFTL